MSSRSQFPFKHEPLKFPKPQVWLKKGTRVVFKWTSYGSNKFPQLSNGDRGTLAEDAVQGIQYGVRVAWDNGEEITVSCFEVRELDALEKLSEV